MRIALCLIVVAACRSSSLATDYCEGGVIKGKPGGGACLQVSSTKPDTDPSTIGSVDYISERSSVRHYTLRQNGKNQYLLVKDGVTAGSIVQNGDWITLRVVSDVGEVHLRSDAPGFLQ